MNKKLLILVILLLVLINILIFYFIMKNAQTGKKQVEEAKQEAEESRFDFSYVQGTKPEYSLESDTEGLAYPGTYKIKSQSWEGDKLKVVVITQSNLCAKKTGSYDIQDNNLTLTVREELKTACNGIGFFDYTFIISPIAQKDYKIILQTENF